MKIYIRHWMGKNPPVDHPSLHEASATWTRRERETTLVPFTVKRGVNAGKTFNREVWKMVDKVVTEDLPFIEVETLDDLLELCESECGILMRPPTDNFPYWTILVDDGGRFTVR